MGSLVPEAPSERASNLLVCNAKVKGYDRVMSLLVDSGASQNFVSLAALQESPRTWKSLRECGRRERTTVRLANGALVTSEGIKVELTFTFGDFSCREWFVVLRMQSPHDLILGFPWLAKHQPWIDWRTRTIASSTQDTGKEMYLRDAYAIDVVDCSQSHDPEESALITMTAQPRVERNLQENEVCHESRPMKPPMTKDSVVSAARMSKGRNTRKKSKRECIPKAEGESNETSLQAELSSAEEIVHLPEMEWDQFLSELKDGTIKEIVVPTPYTRVADFNGTSTMDEMVLEADKKKRFAAQGWDALKGSPFYDVLWKHRRVFPDEVPSRLPVDRGIKHEIDLEPGTKYCVTRQWPLPKEQVDYIDEFFAKRAKSGQVRESKSPHCSPTFCVRKATGGWRVVHAYNKLNAATIPAQTPIPRKDVLLNSMAKSTIFSSMDLMDGYYQVLMREADIPKTAVSTPSGMLWEWLVMPQGLKNAPATFNRLVAHVMRQHRAYAPHYFDDLFIHSRAEPGLSDIEVHRRHLDAVLQTLGDSGLFCNLKKCVFGAPEIPVLGCFVGRDGVRADPQKIKAVQDWPVPQNVKDLRQFLGLANYLHKYCQNYAARAKPLTDLLKKETDWLWTQQCDKAFADLKRSLVEAPVLALPDSDKPFSVVCDASNYAIGCALIQTDADGRERVISYQSRLLKSAELNYPVHDKELLAIKYALVKFRVHLLGPEPFTVYTDHASLRTAINSPHLSPRMARWSTFFSEYNFRVEYKPGKSNVLADALSRRPDFEAAHNANVSRAKAQRASATLAAIRESRVQSSLASEIKERYDSDEQCRLLLAHFKGEDVKLPPALAAKLTRFSYSDGLLWHQLSPCDPMRIYVPHDEDLKLRLIHELHDAPPSGHLGREKTFLQLSNEFWWPHMYKWVTNYIRSCEQCQRVKPSRSTNAPLKPLPIPPECWKSVSLDFIFGFPPDHKRRTGVVVFVDRLSKMVHLAPCTPNVTGKETAELFLDHVFRLHGLPDSLVSDRDPRFTSAFWRHVFALLGTKLQMSTTDHPQTDGQTERVNRVVEDILRSVAEPTEWSKQLPLVEFAINNSVHASTGETPFYLNGLRHPRTPVSFVRGSSFSGGGPLTSLGALSIDALTGDGDLRPTPSSTDSGDLNATPSRSDTLAEPAVRTGDGDLSPSPSQMEKCEAQKPTSSCCSVAEDPPDLQGAQGEILEGMVASDTIDGSPSNHLRVRSTPVDKADSVNKECPVNEVNTMKGTVKKVKFVDEVDNMKTVKKVKKVKKVNEVAHTMAFQAVDEDEDDAAKSAQSGAGASVKEDKKAVKEAQHFVDVRLATIRKVRDAMASAQDRQKHYADRHGRANHERFEVGEQVLLNTATLPKHAVSTLPGGATKLLPRFIGPYTVLERVGDLDYRIDLPAYMSTHPVFYVGRLKRYADPSQAVYPAERGGAKGSRARKDYEGRENARSTASCPQPRPPARQGARGGTSTTPSPSDGSLAAPALTSRAERGRRRSAGAPCRGAPAASPRQSTPQRLLRERLPHGQQRKARGLVRGNRPPPAVVDRAGQKHFHVEKLLQVRRRAGVTQVRVRWKGYDSSQDSWEPVEALRADVPDLVAAFERARSQVQRQ